MASRFACVTDEGVNNLVKDKNSPNTHKATDVAWRIFECYLKDKSLSVDIASVLNAILRKFYVQLRKEDGTLYKKTAFNSVRAGVQRRKSCARKSTLSLIRNSNKLTKFLKRSVFI